MHDGFLSPRFAFWAVKEFQNVFVVTMRELH
jgi:hypothetical protein